jgi:HEAT repeat protein
VKEIIMNVNGIRRRWTTARFLGVIIFCCTPVAAQSNVDKAWGVLSNGLAEHNAEHRAKAVQALRLLPEDHKAEELAEKALGDSAPPVRAAAADALGAMNAKKAVPKLQAALKDTEAQVVFAAAAALYQMQDPAAYRSTTQFFPVRRRVARVWSNRR